MSADVASPPMRQSPTIPARWQVALFALCLAVCGLVGLTLAFSGPATYVDIARASGRETATFRISGSPERRIQLDLDALLGYHVMWADYVTGRTPGVLRTNGTIFTPAEFSHMADVRNVFIAAQVAAVLAGLAAAGLAVAARQRGALARLVRSAALAALATVAVVGILAAVAFDAAFLLFHQVFFPQGNFLFASDSNLLAIYPESYFYGVSLRIGASFVALAGLLAVLSHAALRHRSASA